MLTLVGIWMTMPQREMSTRYFKMWKPAVSPDAVMVLAEWAGNQSGYTCRYFIDSIFQCCGCCGCKQMSVSFSVKPAMMRAQCWCVKTGIIGVYIEHEAAACRCAHACRMHGLSRGPGPFDLTQPWTLLPWRSIRIIYPTPSLSSRLMHGGVKHLVMLNHSGGGGQYARSHPEWQRRGRGRRPKKYRIALREGRRGDGSGAGGKRGLEGRGRGHKSGSSWSGSAWKPKNIKYGSNTSVTIRKLLPHFSSLDILSPFLYFFSTQVKI